jgi:hypothetical protein
VFGVCHSGINFPLRCMELYQATLNWNVEHTQAPARARTHARTRTHSMVYADSVLLTWTHWSLFAGVKTGRFPVYSENRVKHINKLFSLKMQSVLMLQQVVYIVNIVL